MDVRDGRAGGLGKPLDVAIFVSMAVVLLSLLAFLAFNLVFQYVNYRDGIHFALTDPMNVNHASVVTYSRAWDFAVAKTSALFLSYLLIFAGAMYVLRAGEAHFELRAESTDLKGALSSSSPGLVMVTLGVALTAHVLSTRTYVEYGFQEVTQPQESVQQVMPMAIEPGTLLEPTASAEMAEGGEQ